MDEFARPGPGPEPGPGEPPVVEPVIPSPVAPPPVVQPPVVPSPIPPPSVAALSEPPAPPRHTRRWILAGGLAILAGGGAGVGAAFLRHRPKHRPPAPPELLLAAAEAERRLIADLVATTGGSAEVRVVIAQATANHRAHLAVLEGLLGHYAPPSTAASRVPGTPLTKAQLRTAEQAASGTAAARALRLSGRESALFASIAACEASHAELFS